jgi:hypothetical protein
LLGKSGALCSKLRLACVWLVCAKLWHFCTPHTSVVSVSVAGYLGSAVLC